LDLGWILFFPSHEFWSYNTHTTRFIADVYFSYIYFFFFFCEIGFGLCSFARVVIIGRFITIYFHNVKCHYYNRTTLYRYCPEGSSRGVRTRENRLYMKTLHIGVENIRFHAYIIHITLCRVPRIHIISYNVISAQTHNIIQWYLLWLYNIILYTPSLDATTPWVHPPETSAAKN